MCSGVYTGKAGGMKGVAFERNPLILLVGPEGLEPSTNGL